MKARIKGSTDDFEEVEKVQFASGATFSIINLEFDNPEVAEEKTSEDKAQDEKKDFYRKLAGDLVIELTRKSILTYKDDASTLNPNSCAKVVEVAVTMIRNLKAFIE